MHNTIKDVAFFFFIAAIVFFVVMVIRQEKDVPPDMTLLDLNILESVDQYETLIAEQTEVDGKAIATDYCKIDLKCSKLAQAITYEARSEPLEGQYAVGSVILNRAENPHRWPDDIIGVIEQRKQFSYLEDMMFQTPPTKTDWQKAYKVAFDLIYNNVGRVKGINHYHTYRVAPSWSKHYKRVATIGAHHFYTSI